VLGRLARRGPVAFVGRGAGRRESARGCEDPLMTYSIVARDPATGQLGVAVQSHFFSVGSVVTWARPGVGAVATQANARLDYGPRGLELMGEGKSAPDALAALRAADPGAAARQVAMVDAAGGVVGYTGANCIRYAGDAQADAVSCQANIMTHEGVPEAMLDAYLWRSGSLADRLYAALVAAEEAGGDLRGRQSAALLVVPGTGDPWETVVSLRVEDDDEPLEELDRLLQMHAAYALLTEGDEASAQGDIAAAAERFRRASELASGEREIRFWGALGMAAAGDEDGAIRELASVCAEDPAWRELLVRLPDEMGAAAQRLLARLT
jgi:uncharacterized Ntn-hydrolase superfamily protein